jgi:hypothetical protein
MSSLARTAPSQLLPTAFHSLKAWPQRPSDCVMILNPPSEAASGSLGSAARRKNLTPEPSGVGLSRRMGTTSMSTATTLAAAKKKRIAARAAARSDRGVMLAICGERDGRPALRPQSFGGRQAVIERCGSCPGAVSRREEWQSMHSFYRGANLSLGRAG